MMEIIVLIVVVVLGLIIFPLGFYGIYQLQKAHDTVKKELEKEGENYQQEQQMNCGKTEKKQIVETGGIKGNLEEVPSNVELEKLEQRILEESRRFPEVSFAKLSRIAKHFYDFGKQAGAKSNYE